MKRPPDRRNFCRLSGVAALAAGVGSVGRAALAHQAERDDSYRYFCEDLVEITAPGKLIGPDGTAQCCWMRHPYLDLNFEDADFMTLRSLQRFRFKAWDMYHWTTPEHYVGLLIAWIGYGGFCSAHVYERASRTNFEAAHIRGPWPRFPMMRNSGQGVSEYQSDKVEARFEVEPGVRRLRMDFPGFVGKGLRVAVDLSEPVGEESICGVFLSSPRRFNYGHKINCMPASGEMTFDGKQFALDPGNSFGAMDFGRGYYAPKLFWYWATASGRQDGRRIGFNLGYGNTIANTQENALFVDGKLHKLGRVFSACDFFDSANPWRVWTEDGRVDLIFRPENVRRNELKIGPLYTIGRPALGYYQGAVRLDSGESLAVNDLFGLFEWVDQKW